MRRLPSDCHFFSPPECGRDKAAVCREEGMYAFRKYNPWDFTPLGIMKPMYHKLNHTNKFVNCQIGCSNKTSESSFGNFFMVGNRQSSNVALFDHNNMASFLSCNFPAQLFKHLNCFLLLNTGKTPIIQQPQVDGFQ